MHKIFGIKEDVLYADRKGAYLIPVQGNQIAVVKTNKGYFLIGGGLLGDETDEACICRECMEETGYTALVNKKICSAETYGLHSEIGHFHPMQSYYGGCLLQMIAQPVEKDHILQWIDYRQLRGKMFSEMQNWALEQFISQNFSNR